jgi:hypothetical protein
MRRALGGSRSRPSNSHRASSIRRPMIALGDCIDQIETPLQPECALDALEAAEAAIVSAIR